MRVSLEQRKRKARLCARISVDHKGLWDIGGSESVMSLMCQVVAHVAGVELARLWQDSLGPVSRFLKEETVINLTCAAD